MWGDCGYLSEPPKPQLNISPRGFPRAVGFPWKFCWGSVEKGWRPGVGEVCARSLNGVWREIPQGLHARVKHPTEPFELAGKVRICFAAGLDAPDGV